MSWKLDDEGARVLLGFEGLVQHVYKDVAGIETVCVGHVVKPEDQVWLRDGVTKQECQDVLKRDVDRFENAVTEVVHVKLSQPMINALISLAFNIGVAAFAKSTIVKELNAGRYSAAADAFLMWRYAQVKQKDGSYQRRPVLLGRRQAEAAMFRTGMLEVMNLGREEPLTLEALLAKAQASMFDLRGLLDDRGLPVGENDALTEDGRLVCLRNDDEEEAA